MPQRRNLGQTDAMTSNGIWLTGDPVADVVDEESLAKVRDSKRAAKAAKKAASAGSTDAGSASERHG